MQKSSSLKIILVLILSGLCFLINFYAGLGFLAGGMLAGLHAWFLNKQIDIFFKTKSNLHIILISYLIIYLLLVILMFVFVKISLPLLLGLATGFFITKIYFYIKKVKSMTVVKPRQTT